MEAGAPSLCEILLPYLCMCCVHAHVTCTCHMSHVHAHAHVTCTCTCKLWAVRPVIRPVYISARRARDYNNDYRITTRATHSLTRTPHQAGYIHGMTCTRLLLRLSSTDARRHATRATHDAGSRRCAALCRCPPRSALRLALGEPSAWPDGLCVLRVIRQSPLHVRATALANDGRFCAPASMPHLASSISMCLACPRAVRKPFQTPAERERELEESPRPPGVESPHGLRSIRSCFWCRARRRKLPKDKTGGLQNLQYSHQDDTRRGLHTALSRPPRLRPRVPVTHSQELPSPRGSLLARPTYVYYAAGSARSLRFGLGDAGGSHRNARRGVGVPENPGRCS